MRLIIATKKNSPVNEKSSESEKIIAQNKDNYKSEIIKCITSDYSWFQLTI